MFGREQVFNYLFLPEFQRKYQNRYIEPENNKHTKIDSSRHNLYLRTY
jgi:hypothetical protein